MRRAAQLAAARAARGEEIGKRLAQEREEAGKQRAHQLRLEHDAEGGDQDAIEALKQLKAEGKFIKVLGGFESKELSRVKAGSRKPAPAPVEPKNPAARPAPARQTPAAAAAARRAAAGGGGGGGGETKRGDRKPPSPPVPSTHANTSSPVPPVQERKAHTQKTPSDPRPRQSRPRPKVPQRSTAASRALASDRNLPASRPAKLRREVKAARKERPSSGGARGNGGLQVKGSQSREERARVAAARRAALDRVKANKSNSKENAAPMSRGQVKWSAAPGSKDGTTRGKPYGESGLSDASRKYRAKKAAGNGGVGNDMDAASAVYKARLRAKKARKKGPLKPSYAAPGSMAANAAKAKERARGKAAFGSGAGSVADDLNEHVFGKSKVKRKVYTSDGKTKEISKARPKGGNRSGSSTSSSRSSGRASTTPRGGRPSPRANPVDMPRGGKKVGGSVVKHRAMDPREARLAALAARGL